MTPDAPMTPAGSMTAGDCAMQYTDPFCLSRTGSTRATAYNWANKSITLNGKTHVVWLDSVAVICARTYDHNTDQWGDTIVVDDGCDNHANPCISADADGRLRLVYGPHGWYGDWNQGRVKWRRARQPGRIDEWDPAESFGYNATAAAIVHTPQGFDAVRTPPTNTATIASQGLVSMYCPAPATSFAFRRCGRCSVACK